MAFEVVVPRLGWSMDEGTFGQWLKRDGEFVARGEALFVLEGEKAAQDIESFDEGTLRIPPGAPQSGDIVKVGQILAYLIEKGEAAPFEKSGAPATARPQATLKVVVDHAKQPLEVVAGSAPVEKGSGVTASPRARRLASKAG